MNILHSEAVAATPAQIRCLIFTGFEVATQEASLIPSQIAYVALCP